jgi:hypothetical protein
MPADERSIWLPPNTDEALLPWSIPEFARRFGTPVAIEAVG